MTPASGGMRVWRNTLAALAAPIAVAACSGGPAGPAYVFVPTPGQGQYVRPQYLAPQPVPRIPVTDTCRSRLYAGLLGQSEGAIYLPGLPGAKRIIRPAQFEGPDNDFLGGAMMEPTFVRVQDYFAGQQVFAPSRSDLTERALLGPEDDTRLTLELDREGYVQEIRCG